MHERRDPRSWSAADPSVKDAMRGLMMEPTQEGDVARRVVSPIPAAMVSIDGAPTPRFLAAVLAGLGWIQAAGYFTAALIGVARR